MALLGCIAGALGLPQGLGRSGGPVRRAWGVLPWPLRLGREEGPGAQATKSQGVPRVRLCLPREKGPKVSPSPLLPEHPCGQGRLPGSPGRRFQIHLGLSGVSGGDTRDSRGLCDLASPRTCLAAGVWPVAPANTLILALDTDFRPLTSRQVRE